jgi:hypothetical protein
MMNVFTSLFPLDSRSTDSVLKHVGEGKEKTPERQADLSDANLSALARQVAWSTIIESFLNFVSLRLSRVARVFLNGENVRSKREKYFCLCTK